MTYDTINDAVTMQQGAAGTLLANRYRIVRQLGQGGMGSVWLAEDTQLDNKLFAVKMLPSILVANKRAYRQLKDEALVAMQLVHPNIVQIRAFEENNGNPFIVMDYIDGQTLDDYLADCCRGALTQRRRDAEAGDGGAASTRSPSGGLPEEEVVRLLKPIAAALDYAHSKGVVHRDVKPGNVMVAKDGTPYILDFGIAREIQETMTRVTGKLSSGTLLYMSPEQLDGEPPKPSQDVYSFAAMVYECLKGEPPFVRGSIEDQIRNKTPRPLGPHFAVSGRVAQGLAKKPDERPPTCAAVLAGSDKKERNAGACGGGGSRWPMPVLVLATIAAAAAAYWRFTDAAHTDRSPAMGDPVQQETNAVSEGVVSTTVVPIKVPGPADVPPVDAPPVTLPVQKTEPLLPKPKPVPRPKPPKADPEFINMTNRLAEAVKERGFEYGKANPFRALPRGFADRLDCIDNASNQWTKIKASYTPKEIDKVRTALDAVTNETEELRREIRWMSKNKEKRDAAVAQECVFDKFHVAEKSAKAELFARAERRPDWERVQGDVRLAKSSIESGRFDEAKTLYSNLQSTIGDILKEEGNKVAEEGQSKFLRELASRGFIQDDRSNKHQPGMEKSISLPGGEKMVLVWCPPGWFMMGSPAGEIGRDISDGVESRHGVWIKNGFWIGKHEVTKDQWEAVMGTMPESQSEADSGWFQGVFNSINSRQKPITGVSHGQCEEFCRRLPKEWDAGLPTEAEWEYACRAGTQTAYSLGRLATGKIINSSMANVETFGGFLEVVGRYKDYSNAWGICDMHGNAREWCADGYGIFTNVSSLSVNPLVKPDSSVHVVRGGACNESLDRCRCSARSAGKADQYTGFRIRCYNLP